MAFNKSAEEKQESGMKSPAKQGSVMSKPSSTKTPFGKTKKPSRY
jgi:hypothetical protein